MNHFWGAVHGVVALIIDLDKWQILDVAKVNLTAVVNFNLGKILSEKFNWVNSKNIHVLKHMSFVKVQTVFEFELNQIGDRLFLNDELIHEKLLKLSVVE